MDNQRKFIIRPITADDDAAIAAIIRDNLRAAHLDIPGTAYFDPELDHLSDFYNAEPQRRRYYIAADENGTVIGGVGYAEFPGVENCAELQKLYLDDTVKGRGYSHELMAAVERGAKAAGYKKLYLETHTSCGLPSPSTKNTATKASPSPCQPSTQRWIGFISRSCEDKTRKWYASYRENLRDAYHFS